MGGSIAYDIKLWRDLSRGESEAVRDQRAADAWHAFLRDLMQ